MTPLLYRTLQDEPQNEKAIRGLDNGYNSDSRFTGERE